MNEKHLHNNKDTIGHKKHLKHLTKIVEDSLSVNNFLESLAWLYHQRNDTHRQCAYCKSDGVDIEASVLCLPCRDHMCEACAGAHRKTRITREHQLAPFQAIGQGLYDHDIRNVTASIPCPEHPKFEASHFCSDCLVITCKSCRSRSHYNHSLLPMAEASSTFLPEIKRIQNALATSCPSLKIYAQSLNQQITTFKSIKDATIAQIKQHVQTVIQMITERGKIVCKQIEDEFDAEKTDIGHRIYDITTSERSTKKSASFLRHLANLGNAEEQMSMYAHVVTRRKELIASTPKMVKSKLGLTFCPGPNTDTNISILVGKITSKRIPNNAKEKPNSYPMLSHLMPATLSPPVLMCSISMSSSSTTAFPSGMDAKGNMLAVVDRENKKILIFDLQLGKLIKEFGNKTKPSANVTGNVFKKPFDVGFLPNGILAITDPEAASVGMYEWTGKFIGNFTGHMKHPRGITINKAGEAVVLDGHLRRLTVHDAKSGELLRIIKPYSVEASTNDQSERHISKKNNPQEETPPIPSPSLKPPVLIDPFYINTTQDGNMVLSDAASPNLKILGPDGQLLAETMDYGTGPDQNLHPSGVCIDKHGYILVADTNNDRIHLGLPDGQMKDTPLLSQANKLSHPVSLCLTPQSGHLVIGQSGGQISIYKYVN